MPTLIGTCLTLTVKTSTFSRQYLAKEGQHEKPH